MIPDNTHFKLWRIALIPIGVMVIVLWVAEGVNYFAWDYYFTKRFPLNLLPFLAVDPPSLLC